MEEEVWKPILYNNKYEISNIGNIKNSKTGYFLNYRTNTKYNTVSFLDINSNVRKTFLIHRLVAEHFIPNPENKPTVNHIDRNTTNNKYNNLEWATLSEQQFHRYKTENSIDFGYGPAKKKILRIDLNNNVLDEYPSLTLAIKWLFDNNYTNFKQFNENTMASIRSKILEQIKGKRITVYGFKWKYEDININNNNEIWLEINPSIVNNTKGYYASSIGRIKSPKGKISSFTINKYNTVNVGNKTYYVHRLIAHTFIPNPENKPIVNHIDGNKLNNNINNLEWVTYSENTLHWLNHLKNK